MFDEFQGREWTHFMMSCRESRRTDIVSESMAVCAMSSGRLTVKRSDGVEL